MDAALYLSAIGLGLAGAPHCAAMCAAPCRAAIHSGSLAEQTTFHVSRVAAYAAAGALAAASVNALGVLSTLSPVFKPLWGMLHAAALALGLWLAYTGRQPEWIDRIGRRPLPDPGRGTAPTWIRLRGPARAGVLGGLWVAWPCGLLQSAILVAALANTPAIGAGIMAVFALVTATSLTAAPWLWRSLSSGPPGATWQTLGVRCAGVLLAAASAWALTSGIWSKIAAYCGL